MTRSFTEELVDDLLDDPARFHEKIATRRISATPEMLAVMMGRLAKRLIETEERILALEARGGE